MNKRIPDELRPVCGCGRPMKLVRVLIDGGKACFDYWACTVPTKQCPVKNANMPVDILRKWEDYLSEVE